MRQDKTTYQSREIEYGEKLNPFYKQEFDIYIKVKIFPAHDIDDISLRDPYQYQTITVLQNNAREQFECLSSADAVLGPYFTAHEPTLSNNDFIEAVDGSYFYAQLNTSQPTNSGNN